MMMRSIIRTSCLHCQSPRSNNKSAVSSAVHPSTTSVHELLECPVCTNSMYPPIHQDIRNVKFQVIFWKLRRTGILIVLCGANLPSQNNLGPYYRQELGDVRCLALEKVTESHELPCKHTSLGCPLDDHKVDMHSGCTFNHRYVKYNPREVENATWMLTVFHCFGQYFCLHFEAFQLGMAPVCMAFLLSWAMRLKLATTVTAKKLGEMVGNSSGKAPPRSIRESHLKVRDGHDGLIIQLNFVNSKKFCRRYEFIDGGVIIHGGSHKLSETIRRSQIQVGAMAADEGKVKIEKFDGADFGFWKMQIEDFLYQKNLYQSLLGKQPEGMKDEDWALLDKQALGVIRLTLFRNVAFNIAKEKTTVGLIATLSSMYEKSSASNKVHLMRRLFNLRMAEASSVAQHLNELNTITTQLSSVKIEFDDEVRALILLSSLPDSWNATVTAVSSSSGNSKLKFDDVQDLDSAKVIEETGDAMILIVNSPTKLCILDLGASFHSTPCREIMENYVSGCEWKITKGALVIARGKKTDTLYITSNLENIIAVADADGKSNIWHQRLGHMSEKGMKTLLSKGKLSDLKNVDVGLCEDCIFGKQKKVSFAKIGKTPKTEKLELVYTDVWGPSPVPSLAVSLYYVTFIDDFTRKVWIYFLKNKSEVFDTFRKWKTMVENETGLKVKRLRSDNGGEYRNRRFRDFCIKKWDQDGDNSSHDTAVEWRSRAHEQNSK
ncbi:E3 ubiquitin-protein ligase SINAT3 [Hibiscus syriacus]|uniref:E3 ubiquitin-protein ligase SINAT3 n=1 Tax=Hibiscus syriacus TaxID=106335 RepID=A0A6A3ATL2_HIBSY|nr:E3 ubiquitin-protein ligase SINAT3 [Hibiscus syriacus]